MTTNEAAPLAPRRLLGVCAALAAGICLATGGIALRLVEAADGWQILFYRGLALALSIFIWMGFHYRTQTFAAFRRLGGRGLFCGLVIGIVAVFYVFAILNTTVANTVVILSLGPLITAALAWVMLREPVDRSTLITMAVATLGVTVMFADGLSGEGTVGMLFAMGAVSCFAVFLVTLRGGRSIDMIPAIGLSGFVAVIVGAIAAPTLVISNWDIGIGVFLGVVQLALGYACITIATRHLSAALVAILILSEVVFAPLFVWVGVGEVPTLMAGLGGLVVISAVAVQSLQTR
jgi:drug/metabolite transporter, DME family